MNRSRRALIINLKVIMKNNYKIRRILAIFLALCLISPGMALAGGKSGKKNFKEGMKYEELQQWDMAAQQFALAVAAEPDNAEYKLHYLRSLQQASLMFVKRGDALMEQNDYAGAYTAYRQAYNFDQGNEISRLKMERMLELQKAQASGAEPVAANRIANVMPTSNDIQVATRTRSRDVVQTISFKDTKFKTVVLNLGRQLGLNVVFDESVKDQPVTIELTEVTVAKALDIIFKTYKYSFEQVDRRTMLVYLDNPTNRPRFESLMVKTYYLGNITAQQARTALQPMLPPGRQMASLDQAQNAGGNLLIVKATGTELQLIQDILDSLDKNKNEVVLDVEIFEVSHDSMHEIGNQIVTSALQVTETRLDSTNKPYDYPIGTTASLGNLGGIGRANAGSIAGNVITPFLGGIGTLIGMPPTQLKLLQSKGNSKLLNRTQIHVLDGQKNTTKVGRSVPVRLGTQFGFGGGFAGAGGLGNGGGVGGQQGTVGGAMGGAIGGALGGLGGGLGYPGIDSIQYRDVGLVIEAKPSITSEGYVEIEMKFETSDVLSSGADPQLTPTFTQRSLNTTARIQDGVTAVVAGVNQDQKGDSRASIPVLGMVPILGRLFTAPRQESRQSDIIITVTPHIVRSQGINKEDHLAKYAGAQLSGPTPSVEDVVYRAQQEEEQERRLIAQQMPQSVPLNPSAPQQALTTPAAFNNAQQPAVQPAVNTSSQPRVINDKTMVPLTANSAPLSASEAGQNQAPVIQPPATPPDNQQNPPAGQPGAQRGIPANQNDQSNPTDPNAPAAQNNPGAPADPAAAGGAAVASTGGTGGAGGKKDAEPDLSQYITRPEQPVEPATVRMASRPEHVELAIARMRAEQEKKMKEEMEREARMGKSKTRNAPPDFPQEFLPQGPQQKVAPVSPKLNASNTRSSGVNLSISPDPIKLQPGKTFTATIKVSGQGQMTGATIGLKYDDKKLKVKSVRDGGLLGPQPDLTYESGKGTLTVKHNPGKTQAVSADGNLILVEFEALAEGDTQITFNKSGSQVRMPGNLNATLAASAAQVLIRKETMTSIPNER